MDVIEKGRLFRAQIENVAFGGDGVARLDGIAVFIPGTLPGEEVIAEISKVKSDFCRARLVRVEKASPHRIEPECAYFGRCPGCNYLHSDYEGELEIKLTQLKYFLERLSPGLGEQASVGCRMEQPYAYRNKIVLHAHKVGGELELGYVMDDNQSTFDIERCLLACDPINDELTRLRAEKTFKHSLHDGMKVTFRHTANDGVTVFRNNAPKKASWLKEETPAGPFSVPLGNFFQVNVKGMNHLFNRVMEEVKTSGKEEFIDLYCGAGFFAFAAAAAGVESIRGVEIEEESIAAARYNLSKFPQTKSSFLAADAVKIAKELFSAGDKEAILSLDPPRNGVDMKVINAIGASPVDTLFYTSCNAATLMRDIKRLMKYGFTLTKIELIDMFSRTAHFELFCVLHRTK